MQPDTTLKLGDFQFAALEIPANIPFGGAQRLAVHQLVGGAKVVDAMGRADDALTWSGIFMGSTAADRARYLDTLRIAGLPLQLTWSTFSYTVLVREFKAVYEKFYQVGYTITCEVVQDNTSPITPGSVPPVDKALTDDATSAGNLASAIGDSTLNGLMATVSSSISAVSSFAKAAQSTINGVLQPLAAARAQVGVLIASASNTVANVSTFGGVVPGTPVSISAAKLTGQVTTALQLSNLYQLRNLLGRMRGNLGSVNSSQRTVATAGGNLFQIAQRQYGDAGTWAGIAAANGLTDPFIQGTKVLTVPPQAGSNSGVLTS